MKLEPRVVLLTGDGLRHAYVAEQLAAQLNLVGVLCETKAPTIAEPKTLPPEEQEILDRHFAERDEVEHRLLGKPKLPADVEAQRVPHKAANRPETYDWVKRLEPDLLVLFGTSIIKAPLLAHFDRRIINIHSGLSPYYRGGATNFWPLYFGEPECVGTTIHLADAGVDAGPILAQVRPEVEPSDRVHQLGTKALMAGVAMLPRVLHAWRRGALQPREQDLSLGRICRRRDFSADAVSAVWRRLDRGMMQQYLSEMHSRRDQFPLIEFESPATARLSQS